jgi:hypothetical protein
MHLAYEYGVRDIWIVNVGDIKPMEFPISFFLDYAWNPDKWNEDNLKNYYTQWATQQFGPKYAKEIGEIIQKYSHYNARRKPELLDQNTYSLLNYGEASKTVSDWDQLLKQAEKINQALPAEYKDAFFELVLHPVKAVANLHEMYYTVSLNKWQASNKYSTANESAEKVKQFYINDSLLSIQYNNGIANGKWKHMMDQTHIGYTYWQQPPVNRMPEVKYVSKDSSKNSIIEDLTMKSSEDFVSKNRKGNLFYELNGYVSLEGTHYTKKVDANDIKWKTIPDIGKDGDGITTFPVTANNRTINANSPHLEYTIYTYDSGDIKLNTYFSPTLNFNNDSSGLRYGISIDDEAPQIISINKDDSNTRTWEQWVANNVIIKTTSHSITKPDKHIVKYWMISPAVILQKIVVDLGGVKPSYLGPPETLLKN